MENKIIKVRVGQFKKRANNKSILFQENEVRHTYKANKKEYTHVIHFFWAVGQKEKNLPRKRLLRTWNIKKGS